jgi:predicted phage tail protein
VALVGLSLLTAGATIGLLGLAAPFAISPILVGIGASLALGGVAQLLTPVPKMAGPGAASMGGMAKAADNNDPRKNYSFSGVQNVTRSGVPCPIQYGETIVGSVVISAGIDVDQVAA